MFPVEKYMSYLVIEKTARPLHGVYALKLTGGKTFSNQYVLSQLTFGVSLTQLSLVRIRPWIIPFIQASPASDVFPSSSRGIPLQFQWGLLAAKQVSFVAIQKQPKRIKKKCTFVGDCGSVTTDIITTYPLSNKRPTVLQLQHIHNLLPIHQWLQLPHLLKTWTKFMTTSGQIWKSNNQMG